MVKNFLKRRTLPLTIIYDMNDTLRHLKVAIISLVPLSMYPDDSRFSWNIALDTEGLYNISENRAGWSNLLSAGVRACLWNGASFDVEALSSYGLNVPVADDIQGFSNLDAGENRAFRFKTISLTQEFGDDWKVSAGLRNVDGDYFTSPMTSFFTGSSYGNFPTLSMNFPLPTFPLSAMGVHVEYSPVEEVVIKESLYNGVASDRLDEQFRIVPQSDGFFNIGSLEYVHEVFDNDCEISSASYTLGYAIGNPLPADDSGRRLISSIWCSVEQPVASMGDACLGLLAQGSWSPRPAIGGCDGYVSAALLWEKDDFATAGLGINHAFLKETGETDIELLFGYSFFEYFTISPGVHFILEDNGRTSVAGLLRLSFEIGNM